ISIAGGASLPWIKNLQQKLLKRSATCYSLAAVLACLLILILSTAYLIDTTYNPFLYFRF
ncbi:MAG: MBOAT family protein, partial [Dethiobacteria bacterium]